MTIQSVHVMAGVIRDDAGRILLAQRNEGSHLAGLWEFPGGKVEVGESRWDALVRELEEEIGIVASAGRPLICVPFVYASKSIRLDVWQIDAYSGEPWSREGQGLEWVDDAALDAMPMPAADKPVVTALRLPHEYLITPDLPPMPATAIIESITQVLRSGITLIQLRLPQWSRAATLDLAKDLRMLTRAHSARLLVNSDIQLALEAHLDGVHLPARIAAQFNERPLPLGKWLAVSCHDADELAHAARIGADFVTLSPVAATTTHPTAEAIGWDRFRDLVADAAIPVYALGGMRRSDNKAARDSGGHGIAAITALWPVPESRIKCSAANSRMRMGR
ncbi:MAG: Nudix family hydrolase [Dokdonella sp.]